MRQGYNFLPSDFPKRVVAKQIVGDHVVAFLSSKDYESIDYADRDWDNLVILDACTYDAFADHNPFEVEPEKVNSNASHTIEFTKRNWSGDHEDTVYLTASPMVSRFGGSFAHIEHLWETHWSEEDKTVRPEDVADAAIDAEEEYPNKRLVVHFMQPHFPFIGEKGKELGGATFNWNNKREDGHIWEKVLAGMIDVEELKEAYEENLEIALPHVKRLAEELDGKTVVTADHGNLFGKKPVPWFPYRVYGHPAYLKDEDLTAVPWLELPFDERKNIVEGEVEEETEKDEEEIKEKLEALGYRQ